LSFFLTFSICASKEVGESERASDESRERATNLLLRGARIVEQVLADDELVSSRLLRRWSLALIEEGTVKEGVRKGGKKGEKKGKEENARREDLGGGNNTAPARRSTVSTV
jgi:hypothetical protein